MAIRFNVRPERAQHYPEITGETSDYPDTSYKTGDDVDFFHNGNVWEQPSVNPEPPAALVSIEITTPPTKVEYNEGEALNLAGLVVTGIYEDSSTKPITKYTATPANGTILSDETEVIIEYQGFTASQPITVIPEAELVSIEVTTPPTKVSYFEGEALDLTGLVVTATYDDGSTVEVAATATPADGTILTTDVTEVTLEFGGKTTTQAISVEAVVLESIEVVTPPTKVVYNEGENLDLTGLVVKAVYNNHEEVINDYTTVPENGAELVNETEVVISYQGTSVVQEITVVPEAELVSIAITTAPTKVAYYEGDELDLTGMVVTGTYDDSSTRTLNKSEYTTNPEEGAVLTNETEVVVTCQGKTATQAISVTALVLESIAITTAPTKVAYYEGDELDLTGMVVTATYNSGSETIGDYTTTPAAGTALTTSDNKFTVEYEFKGVTKTAEQVITVAAIVVESIEITKAPNKVEYFEGQTLDLTGIEVTAHYNDGHTAPIDKSNLTSNPAEGTALTTSVDEVAVTYEGKSDVQSITVIAVVLESIAVTKAPDKVVYDVGETLDLTGMEVTGIFNDEHTELINGYTTDPADGATLAAGTTEVAITYQTFSTSQAIQVGSELESIEITDPPTKTIYHVGEPLEMSPLEITVHYKDSSTRTVGVNDVVVTPAVGTPITIEYDENPIVITYTEGGLTAETTWDIIVFA